MLPLFPPPLFWVGTRRETNPFTVFSLLPSPIPTYNVTTVVTPTSTQTIYHPGVCSAGNYRVWWWCTTKAENVVSLLCAERRLQRNGGMRGGVSTWVRRNCYEYSFSFPGSTFNYRSLSPKTEGKVSSYIKQFFTEIFDDFFKAKIIRGKG